MLRFYFIICTGIVLNIYFIPLMWYYAKHPERYSEEECYKVARDLITMIRRRGKVTTIVTGAEKLPEESGYIMYSNHQGKYDMLGIVSTHEQPSTIVIDIETTKDILPRLYTNLVKGKRLDKKDPRQQVAVIHEVIEEILKGRKYLLFPEGGYSDNKNQLQDFHTGSFKIPLKAKCPIVPVAIFDSYRPFSENSLRRVTTQVHYLDLILYDEYSGLSTKKLCELVYTRIYDKLTEIENHKIKRIEAKKAV